MEALECYCELMEDWANSIMSDDSIESCFPVAAAPTKEHAQMLLTRTQFIRREFLSQCQTE